MNKLARNLLTLMLVGSVLVVYGCEKDEDGGPTRPPAENWRDIVVTLQNMDSHLGQLIAFRVVSRSDPDKVWVYDELRAVARIDTLDQATFTFTMPLAVPEGLHRLDFWCDNNGNGWVDPSSPGPGGLADHSYRITLNETGAINVTFVHPDAAGDTLYARFYSLPDSAMFLDVNQPLWITPEVPPVHFWMTFTQMDTAIGHALELQVVDPSITGGRTVGCFRKSNVIADSFQIVLPSIGDLNEDGTGKQFQIDFYVDMDDSGGYNAADFAWSVPCITGTYLDTIGANTVVAYADSLISNFAFNTDFATGFVWP